MLKGPLFVVPVDFSPEMEATVSAAFALAKQCGANVHLLEVVPPRGPSLLDATADIRLSGRVTSKRDWSRLEHSIHAAERGRIHVHTVAYRGDATKTNVVSATHEGESARYWSALRNVSVAAEHTNRQHPQPSCTYSRARSAATTPVRKEQIAVVRSYRFGRRLYGRVRSSRANGTRPDSQVPGARLTLVHALTNAPRHMVFSGGEALKVARNLRGQAAQVAERLRRKIPSNIRLRVDARVTTGDPHRGILEIASEVDADLIVMGLPPRTRFDEVLFGSTLRKVLRRTKIPVLVARSDRAISAACCPSISSDTLGSPPSGWPYGRRRHSGPRSCTCSITCSSSRASSCRSVSTTV